MKVSLRWLEDYIDLPTRDPEDIRVALASLGHEVEGVERLEADWTGVVVARVLTVDPHPDADKVRVCTVTTGGDPIRVICGAWNFEADAVVAFAQPGAVLPGGFEIGVRTIRGVESNGMICSERELLLGDDHAGILVLEPDAPVGAAFSDYVELPDVVFDLSITPNRPDAMSMVGIARDLGAYYGVAMRPPVPQPVTTPGAPSTRITIEDAGGCFRFTARELDGVAIGPSPLWMRRRLRVAGMRPISNAVDVTNYVMLELGHPLHAFDADRVAGDALVVRRAHDGETLVTLDGVERSLVTEDLVICDADGPTSLAGTMGGADSEVGNDSRRILLEAASWHPPTIMWMSRRHNLRSEASARFERGVDRELPLLASARAAELLLETGGGTLLDHAIDVVAVPFERPRIELSRYEVTRTLGPGLPPEHVAGLLRSIGLDVEGDDPLIVTIPGFRPDLERPIDLIEEVARLHGYGEFPDSVPTGFGGGWTPEQRRARTLRAAFVGAGLDQAVHLSFIGKADLDAFGYPGEHPARSVVVVKNPLREEESMLRTTLLPSLLASARYNLSHGADSVGLFEVGKVFFARPDATDPRIPDQPDRVGFVLVGGFGDRSLADPPRPVDFHTGSAVWRTVARRLGLHFELEPAGHPGFHPGRTADVVVTGSDQTRHVVGVIGEIHPRTAAAYELPGRVVAGELDLDRLLAPVPLTQLSTPSTFPPVEFDLAFLVEPSVPADALLDATTEAAAGLVERAFVFDEYVGLEAGRRSLAIRYVLRAADRTLTNEEVAPVRGRMVQAAEAMGAELRGKA